MNKILIIIIVILSLILLSVFIRNLIFQVRIRTILNSYECFSSSDDLVRAIINSLLTIEERYELQYKVDELNDRDYIEEKEEEHAVIVKLEDIKNEKGN